MAENAPGARVRIRRAVARAGWLALLAATLLAPCTLKAQNGAGTDPDQHLARAERSFKAHEYVASRSAALAVLEDAPRNGRALWLLGWSEYQLGNYGPARTAFRRLAALDPSDVEAHIGLGWSNLKLGHLDEARTDFETARPRAAGDQRYIVADGLGWIAYVQGRFEEAAALFRSEPQWRRAGTAPEDSDLGLAWIAMTEGRLDAAEKHLRRGLQRQPRYFRLYAGLSRVDLFRDHPDAALKHVLAAFQYISYNRELALLLDAALRRLGNIPRSAEVYETLSQRYPEIPAFLNGLGWSELELGKLRHAEAHFIAALNLLPHYALAEAGLQRARAKMHTAVARAWRLYEQGLFEDALAAFDRHANALGGTNPAVHAGRGWSLLMLGEPERARDAFRKALEVDPHFELAQQGLAATQEDPYRTVYWKGWDLLEVRRFAAAATEFRRAAKGVAPWRIEEALAWVHLLQERIEQAAKSFEDIVESQPKAYLSLKGLGYVAIERGQYEQALRRLRHSFDLEPGQIPTSFTVPARRLIEAREYEKALEVLEMGTKSHPDVADIHFLMAIAYQRLGRTRAAAEQAARAARLAPTAIHGVFDQLELDPKQATGAYLAMARGLYAAGDNEGARQRFTDYLNSGGNDPAARRGRGFALYRLGWFRQAVDDLRRITRFEPEILGPVTDVVHIPGTGENWPITYNGRSTLAWAYLYLGEARSAADEFRTTLKTYPTWIDALSGLGYSLLALGDGQGAKLSFRTAIMLSPGYPDAWRGLRRAGGVG
jgi:tetratricopeptide (TPR) repeat protein